MHRAPTERQLEVLLLVRDLTDWRGYPPSYRDLADALRVASSNTVAEHVRALVARGLLESTPKVARSLRLTAAGRAVLRG